MMLQSVAALDCLFTYTNKAYANWSTTIRHTNIYIVVMVVVVKMAPFILILVRTYIFIGIKLIRKKNVEKIVSAFAFEFRKLSNWKHILFILLLLLRDFFAFPHFPTKTNKIFRCLQNSQHKARDLRNIFDSVIIIMTINLIIYWFSSSSSWFSYFFGVHINLLSHQPMMQCHPSQIIFEA